MSADVHVGREGWLFLSGGSNDVLRFYTEPGRFAQGLPAWIALLRQRSERARSAGAQFLHVIVPDKISVYPEFYLDPLPCAEDAPCRALRRALAKEPDGDRLSASYVDLLAEFEARKREGPPLYFKTDAHWTFAGAYAGYAAICRALNAPENTEILAGRVIGSDLLLDLGGKLTPPVKERYETHLFAKNAQRKLVNDLVAYKEETNQINVAGLHVGSQVVFENAAAADPRRVVLFGDSYSEYRTHMLTGMIAETFAETHFVWSTNVDWTYISNVRPDIVITEMAERFVAVVPRDDLELDRFVAMRLESFKSGRG